MNTNIEWSKRYCTEHYRWKINDSTFQILDEENVKWIAMVTEVNELSSDEQFLNGYQEGFFVLVHNSVEYIILDIDQISTLCQWCIIHKERGDI